MNDRQSNRRRNRRWPKIWLMTDPRFDDDLLPAIRRLPLGSGVIFRHYTLEHQDRRRLFRAVRHICRQRGHKLLLAGPELLALRWQADGFHSRRYQARSRLPRSAPVHDRAELQEALRSGAELIFLSPLFATASHPGGRALGRLAFNALAKQAGGRLVIALGGMTRNKARGLPVHGWAAIDALKKSDRNSLRRPMVLLK
jgi:thiamine-phosphate pyrophosphorylase